MHLLKSMWTFHLYPLRLCHHHITEKRKKERKKPDNWFFCSCGLKLRGSSYILLQVRIFSTDWEKRRHAVREGGCWGTTCCRCPTVLTTQIKEEGKYLLQTHRFLDIFKTHAKWSHAKICRHLREWLLCYLTVKAWPTADVTFAEWVKMNKICAYYSCKNLMQKKKGKKDKE